jgi:hypothetical protein
MLCITKPVKSLKQPRKIHIEKGNHLLLELEDELLSVHLLVHNGAAVLEEKVPLDLGKEQVGHQEYLRRGEDQVDGEVVVGVGRVVVDPELPGNGGQECRGHHHSANDKGLKIESMTTRYRYLFKNIRHMTGHRYRIRYF